MNACKDLRYVDFDCVAYLQCGIQVLIWGGQYENSLAALCLFTGESTSFSQVSQFLFPPLRWRCRDKELNIEFEFAYW